MYTSHQWIQATVYKPLWLEQSQKFFVYHSYIDNHFRRVCFSEAYFIVNLDGNVLETVNLSCRDRVRGVMEYFENVAFESTWYI